MVLEAIGCFRVRVASTQLERLPDRSIKEHQGAVDRNATLYDHDHQRPAQFLAVAGASGLSSQLWTDTGVNPALNSIHGGYTANHTKLNATFLSLHTDIMGSSGASSPSGCSSSLAQLPNADFSSDDDSDEEVPDPSSDACRSIKDITSMSTSTPTTQKRRQSYYGVHPDKESLLEELLALQDAFQDQQFHLKAHREHHNAMKEENSKLESRIEYLETTGLEAPRTGGPTKLKSKLKGCKARLMDLETTCSTNAAGIKALRMDSQFMKTKEAIVQRELFALEVRRLQRCVFIVQNLYKKVSDENMEIIRVKEKIAVLTAKNQELESSVPANRKSVEAMITESEEWMAKRAAAKTARAKDNNRFKSLQQESKSLMDTLFKEKQGKGELTTVVNTLSFQVREAKRDTREKARDAAYKTE